MPSLDEFIKGRRASAPLAAIKLSEPVPVEALHTPALVIDLDVFESNLKRMQAHVEKHGMALRPHTKMHKCPEVAHRQLALGATGVCAAKVSEAELMVDAGIGDVLITSPIATPEKYRRVVDLACTAPDVKVVVDCQAAADSLSELAQTAGITLGVYIDVDPGMGRTGIAAEGALDLARHIQDACGSLNFGGLQMYAGDCMHIQGFEARRNKYGDTMAKGLAVREQFDKAGIQVPVVTGGGTGTYDIEPALGLMTELQAGSYAFMDIEYRDIGGEGDEAAFTDFPISLFVLCTAISQPQSRLITVDAGFKSLASDKMAPEFRDVEGVIFHWGGDEHGIVQLRNPSRQLALSEKLELLTPHCDPTVNLHDYCFPYRHGMVSEIWPISARGASQ